VFSIVIEAVPDSVERGVRSVADGPLVVQYWDAEQPPQEIVELLASFPRHNPGLRQIVFSEASAEAFIAERFTDREVAAFRACAVPTSQADYLRYCAGYVLGGLCIDADVRCGGDLNSLLGRPQRGIVLAERDQLPDWIERIFAWPYTVGSYRIVVNGAFAFARAGDPLPGLAIEISTANIENRLADGRTGVWLTTGPGVFTSIYLLWQLGSFDAFLAYTAGTVLEPTAALFCEVVEDPSRAEEAFDGLDMAAAEEVDDRLLQHVGIPRRAAGVSHWSNPEGSIFR
jgi:hypothetical protein